MKKNFKYYAILWGILLLTFNAVVFSVRSVLPGFEVRYDARFWISWAFILAAFLGNLVCAYFAFKADNLGKTFLNLPLITLSRSALIAMIATGAVLMLIPNLPAWIAAIVCVLILAFNAIAVIKAAWAADAVNRVGEKVKAQTSFIKNLTVDAESILSRAKSAAAKNACRKVYEAVRYSDPTSNKALSAIEEEITRKTEELSDAVNAPDEERILIAANELLVLIGDRNRKCKASKL